MEHGISCKQYQTEFLPLGNSRSCFYDARFQQSLLMNYFDFPLALRRFQMNRASQLSDSARLHMYQHHHTFTCTYSLIHIHLGVSQQLPRLSSHSNHTKLSDPVTSLITVPCSHDSPTRILRDWHAPRYVTHNSAPFDCIHKFLCMCDLDFSASAPKYSVLPSSRRVSP